MEGFTNCDIPPNHLISIDFRTHNLPCTSPCICNAPTCAVTLPDSSRSTCSVINRTYLPLKQTKLPSTYTIPTITATRPNSCRRPRRTISSSNLTQSKLTQYMQHVCAHFARPPHELSTSSTTSQPETSDDSLTARRQGAAPLDQENHRTAQATAPVSPNNSQSTSVEKAEGPSNSETKEASRADTSLRAQPSASQPTQRVALPNSLIEHITKNLCCHITPTDSSTGATGHGTQDHCFLCPYSSNNSVT
jgi:hypothetical protein